MAEKTVVVQNQKGIHLRPSSLIAQAMQGFEGKAYAIPINGRQEQITPSPFSVMGLALHKGDVVTIRVEGEGAELKLLELSDLFGKVYDFV